MQHVPNERILFRLPLVIPHILLHHFVQNIIVEHGRSPFAGAATPIPDPGASDLPSTRKRYIISGEVQSRGKRRAGTGTICTFSGTFTGISAV